jgi:hypothetical protein
MLKLFGLRMGTVTTPNKKRERLTGLYHERPDLEAYFGTFCKSLKAELICRQKLLTWRQAEAAIFQYINGFCNTRRHHSYLGSISPLTFKAKVA